MPEKDSEREAERLDAEAYQAWYHGRVPKETELKEKARAMRERLAKKEATNGND